MKTYKLIWLDDEDANIEALRSKIEDFIKYCGYSPEIRDFRTFDDEFLSIIGDTTINLIITDLNLLGSINGQEVINMIRQNSIWHDILLYSSDSKMLKEAILGLDGIFFFAFNSFDGLFEKIKAVIQANIVRDQYALTRN